MKAIFVDWSGLPPELLARISDHIKSAFDYMRFRCVCNSWRLAVPERIFNPLLVSFTLPLDDDDDDNTSTSTTTTTLDFFSFRGAAGFVQIEHNLLFPELPPNKLCCGSSHGWLILTDQISHVDTSSLTLFNPFTKSRIDLPSYFPSLPQYKRMTNFRLVASFNRPTKIVLSADPSEDSNFSVILMYAQYFVLWRSVEGSWTEVELPDTFVICEDALFYKGQLLFTSYGDIFAYNVERHHFTLPLETDEMGYHFLVKSADDLIFVQMIYGDEEVFSCEVYQVVLGEVLHLVKLEELGDRALFLGHNLGISVPASEYPGCKSNCIYLALQNRGPSMVVRVSLEDGSNECVDGPLYQDMSRRVFVSNLWLKA